MMKKIILLICCLYSSLVLSKGMIVESMHGDATVLLPTRRTAEHLSLGQNIPEDSSIVSMDKSFVKLRAEDGSIISIGANSKIVVNILFDKKTPTVISLLIGSLRAKVNKQVQLDSQKEKFIVKSRNAALGVRGTEFQITTSQDLNATSLVLIEGKVAFKKTTSEELIPKFNYDSVIVKGGEFSAVRDDDQEVLKPIIINEKQFKEIKDSDEVYESDVSKVRNIENYIDLTNGKVIDLKKQNTLNQSENNYLKNYIHKVSIGYAYNTTYFKENESTYKYSMDSFFIDIIPYNWNGFDFIVGLDFYKKPEILSITNPSMYVSGDEVSSGLMPKIGFERNWFYKSMEYGFGFELDSKKILKTVNQKITTSSSIIPVASSSFSYHISNLKLTIKPKIIVTDEIHLDYQVKSTILTSGLFDYSLALDSNHYNSKNSNENLLIMLDFGF